MAGLIKALFGGKASPAVDTEPAPGVGGYNLGAGPANQSGFPGSTSQVRTNRGKSPRDVKVLADTDTGANNGLSDTPVVRQASYRGDIPGANVASPRATGSVMTRKTVIRDVMQSNSGAEFYGGPMLKTGPGNDTAGGNPLGRDGVPANSVRDATTPWSQAQHDISGNVPGSQNVRNEIAQRYKQPPGIMHSYLSAPRADTAPVNPGGQATDGNVHPDRVVQSVTVPNRFTWGDGGVQTWEIMRRMPYTGRGDGARGADLNGQRYYAAGQADQYWNGGQGEYGIARRLGGDNKRPVSFTQPAPWTGQYYDTTESVGSPDSPNQAPAQQVPSVYYSPGGLRASSRTGRTG